MNALTRKTLGKLTVFQIFLAFLLFLPAWSFLYWQAWLFWIVFSIAQFSVTIYFLRTDPHLIENRLKAGPRAESRPAQKLILACALLLSWAMVMLPGVDRFFRWSAVPVPLVLFGDAGVAAGMYLVFLTFRANTYAAATIRLEENQHVISTGLYGLVRHPMYLGATILFVSVPLALGSYWALLLVPPLIALFAARLLDEERFLSANLSGYDAYCQKVRFHMIPYVW